RWPRDWSSDVCSSDLNFVMEKFLKAEVDKVSVLFTHFINTINQRPVVETLLPISAFDLPKGEVEEGSDPLLGYTFEPKPEEVLRSEEHTSELQSRGHL